MKTQTTETARIHVALRHGIRAAAVLSLALIFSGCGGSGGGSAPAAVDSVNPGSPAAVQASVNSFAITSDDYGVGKATYLAATKSSTAIVLRAAVATSMTDPAFRTVARIDIANPQAVTASCVYSLGAATAGLTPFAGNVDIFNGHQSTLLSTVGGTISFSALGANSGDRISGTFSAIVEDGNDTSLPKGSYTISGKFDFVLESTAPVLPAAAPVSPNAVAQYDANCASCHALGSLDSTAANAVNLSLKGGKMNGRFTPDVPSHQGIRLATTDISDLKVLLNMN